MSEIVEKVLRSGLIDKHTAEFMERLGLLEEGASAKVKDQHIENASRAQMAKLAEELAKAVESERDLRETYLDLERLRYPVEVNLYKSAAVGGGIVVAGLQGLIDRMGRYYFNYRDVDQSWFVPGRVLKRTINGTVVPEMITESQVLHVRDTPACVQVSTFAIE